MEGFHGGQPPLDADGIVHIVFEALIQRIYRPRDTGVREGFDQIKIPQHQVAFGGDTDFDPAALELLQQRTSALEHFFLGQIWIGDRTDKQLFPGIPLRAFDLRPVFHV